MEQNENASNNADNDIPSEQLKKCYFWEADRLESFKHWPFDESKPCNIKKMAEAGFYWCGTESENDTAACFLCNKHLDGWEVDDDPWQEHFKHAPQCHFAKARKPEEEYTVEEILTIFEIMLKNNLQRKYEADKKVFKEAIEQKRKALTKSLFR